MDEAIAEILSSFGLDAGDCAIQPVGSGHIHDTYRIDSVSSGSPPLLLQKINTRVFTDPALLMRNLERVSTHIARKHKEKGEDPAQKGIVLLETTEGKSWTGNETSGYWRMCWFLQDLVIYEQAPHPKIAWEGGRAIAEFQGLVQDLDPTLINDVIEGFHDLKLRMEQFKRSLSEGLSDRIRKAAREIQLAKQEYERSLSLYTVSEKLDFPIRLNHNDTKLNNILFSKEGQACCMIDLDTVMKGYSWFDFGDALRTCASSANEDEANQEKIEFLPDTFKAFSAGYLSLASAYLHEDERAHLHLAPAVMTYMQGLRFLTDYLMGDIYYKSREKELNLVRARGQFLLMQKMHAREKEMAETIRNLS